MADADLVSRYAVDVGALYSISKAALNMAAAKFHAQYRKDGVLFLCISPGVVDVGKSAACELLFFPSTTPLFSPPPIWPSFWRRIAG